MQTTLKTWPYGTQRTGVVCIARWHSKELPPDVANRQLIRDNLGEMHVCVGDECAELDRQKRRHRHVNFRARRPHRRLLAMPQKLNRGTKIGTTANRSAKRQ
jgi:hypothetical protein